MTKAIIDDTGTNAEEDGEECFRYIYVRIDTHTNTE